MSAAATEKSDDTNAMGCCASCGIAGGDDIKLKNCTACHLVKYCGVDCQRNHWAQHKRACKKRAAELRDEILFKQPESSHFGDCPICCLPQSIDASKSTFMSCCSKMICIGCYVANIKREVGGRLQLKCPFCRNPAVKTDEQINEQSMRRINEANDPGAMSHMGGIRYHEGDFKGAFELIAKAASLGDVKAHHELSVLYKNGKGVEKDEKKARHHTEQAAIGGHPEARHNLGSIEKQRGRMDRAAKHWIIAAKLGVDMSLDYVKKLYKAGVVSKEDFDAALRGHHAAVNATKSPQREEAAEYYREMRMEGVINY